MSGITAGKKRFVKRALALESPTVWVGKGGANAELLKEIDKQLAKRKMVKVKILKTALADVDAKELAVRVARECEAFVVEIRGHTFMLYKPRKK